MKNNDHKIGKIVKSWILTAGLTQGEAARFLGIKQGTISMMLSGKAAFPKDKIRMLIDKFNPPQDEVTKVLKLFFWENANADIKFSIEAKAKKIMNAVDNGTIARGILKDLEQNMEEVCIIQNNGKDALLLELLRAWEKFDMPQKLKVLTTISELKNQKD